ncbi:hypothetical protein MKJ04_05430 [Pontibacter sp. E15-1]|uniref:hypothetical protein n=1 Tax=Pontibacter sp. E15-1 TaxID=2919918 RepID=UPI001F4FA16B|nr:hypothetical protein [Pontibacter sp. E15-1]MCJ8164276.1 hypothetical protein [Pontibacter sp. E15-1]
MRRNDRDQQDDQARNWQYDSRDHRQQDLTGDFERHYQQRHHPRDGNDNFYRNAAYERDADYDRARSYRHQDEDVERNYHQNTRGERDALGDIRQGYGYSSFGGAPDSGRMHNPAGEMQRERRAQQEQRLNSQRPGGYSGSGFGGANYSAHGSFGGSSDYGAMSGSGGNARHESSSSGYGGDQRNFSHDNNRAAYKGNQHDYTDSFEEHYRRRNPNRDAHRDADKGKHNKWFNW